MEEIDKENDAKKRKLNDVIEEMQSQQDEIFELLRTVNEKKIELIKNAIRLQKFIEGFKEISPCVPTHMVDEYNETIERCGQSIEQAREFVWKMNKGIGSISMNDDPLWVQVPTSSD